MKHDCLEVEPLLGRTDDLLAAEERARRARHLAECASCRADEHALREVGLLMRRPRPVLSEAARERALAAAFVGAQAPGHEAKPRATLSAVVALAAAAIALLALLRPAPSGEPPPPRIAAPVVAPNADAIAGRGSAPSPEAEGATVPRAADEPREPVLAQQRGAGWIEPNESETRRFAHAEVTLRAGTRARFDAQTHTLELARGEVRVSVDPRLHAPFAVVTQHLRVEVLGTVFTVAPRRVAVQRGRVRVLDARGAVLAAQLSAGSAYVVDGGASHTGATKPGAGNAELLREARRALGRADVAGARALLARFDAAKAGPMESAEAGTLQAECALLEHDAPAALRAYLDVATRFPSLPAGENAAFAAAQLAARHGDARAQALFERYLARYPNGGFAREARAALAR